MQIEMDSCHQQTKSSVLVIGSGGGGSSGSGSVAGDPVPGSSNGNSILPDFNGFLDTGRTGRRNAIPDIHVDPTANVSTADLPLDFEKLTCSNS